jgi:hypothetical protein
MARRQEVETFVRRALSGNRRSQQTTAADLLAGLLRVQKIGLTSVVRGVRDDTTVKHRIKRVGRFCQNMGINMQDVFDGVADYVLARDTQNVIALDWTDLGDYMLLKASLIFRKRSVPVAWRCVWKEQYEKSQNDEEEKLMEQLIHAVGKRSWVLLADRGFGRADFFRWLDERGVKFVIRVSGNAWIEHQWFTGTIDNIPRRAGRGWMYKAAWYRRKSPVLVNVACHHKEPAPAPWYLVTNIDTTARKVASLYSKRMGIEEGIRDCKSGLDLKHLWLGGPERMDRAMILVTLAVLLAALTAAKSIFKGEQLKQQTKTRTQLLHPRPSDHRTISRTHLHQQELSPCRLKLGATQSECLLTSPEEVTIIPAIVKTDVNFAGEHLACSPKP